MTTDSVAVSVSAFPMGVCRHTTPPQGKGVSTVAVSGHTEWTHLASRAGPREPTCAATAEGNAGSASLCSTAGPPQALGRAVAPSVGDVLESLSLPSRRLFDRLPATSCATNAVSGGIRKRAHGLWQRTTNPRLHHLGQTVYRADGVGEVSM